MNVEILFPHGLGDCVQFSVILKHLRHDRPDWHIDVVTGTGKSSILTGQCRNSLPGRSGKAYDASFSLGWFENYNRYQDRPNSKITNCLADQFHIDYRPEWGRYEVYDSAENREIASRWLKSIGGEYRDGRYNVVMLHYQGNTAQEKKNFSHEYAKEVCGFIRQCGRIPLLLDWDRRSPLPDGKTVHCFDERHEIWGRTGTGDGAMLAALVRCSEAFVGIDSGPGKVASATDTPNLSVWNMHHPLQFHDPSPSTTHLVPAYHERNPPLNGDKSMKEYFERHYRFRSYEINPQAVVCDWLTDVLNIGERPSVVVEGFKVPVHDPEQAFTIIEDVYLKDAYKTRLRPKSPGEEFVIDVGANIGAFARLWRERNPDAKIVCVEMHADLAALCGENVVNVEVVNAACTYQGGDLAMLDACISGGRSIGGSRLVRLEDALGNSERQYKLRKCPPTVTIEGLCSQFGFPRIDVLKLDCEGSEFSILEHCDLSKVGMIFVESHDRVKWRHLLQRRFHGWHVGHISANGDCETWHLANPAIHAG